MDRLSICATCMYALMMVLPYVREGVDDGGDCSIVKMSDAAWRRYYSVVTFGKEICSGKKSTVSACTVPLVEARKHCKQR